MANSCALARERLARTVSKLREASTLEKGIKLIKTGFLGSVVTPMKALGGNALSLGYRTLVEHPVRAGVDYVRAVGQAAAHGDFTLSPDAYRAVRLSLDTDGLGTLIRGFKAGAEPAIASIQAGRDAFTAASGARAKVRAAVTTFAEELNTRLDAESVNRTLDYNEVTYKNPVTDAVVNSVMGVMEAVDRPYWRAAHDFSLHMQSKMAAAAEGLRGKPLQERAARLFEQPTDEMTFRAVADANYTTFKNKNFLSRMASGVKRTAQGIAEREPTAPQGTALHGAQKSAQLGGKVGSYVLETNLPFTGVPSSIAGQAFGLASGPLGLVRLLTNRDPAVTSRIISDAALGTAIMAWGYQLARDGKLNGAAPTSPTERAQFDAEGRQAWSVRLGDTWYDTRFAVPVAAPLYAGAALANVKKNDPNATVADKGIAAVGATAKMLTQQTYLQNLSALIDALSAPEKKGARFVASQVPVPALAGQIARATDDKERKPEGVLGMVAAKIPGLSKLNPVAVDALGREQTRTPVERASELLSPSRIKESTETPVTKEFARLGVSLSLPGKSSTLAGRTFTRSGEEQSAYIQQVGQDVAGYLGRFIESPVYRGLQDEQRAIALQRVLDKIHQMHGKAAAGQAITSGKLPTKVSRVVRAQPIAP